MSLHVHRLAAPFRKNALHARSHLSASTACTRRSDESSSAALKVGKPLFQFDYETVTELLIVKADPLTGDHWSMRLARPDTKSMNWEIKSESNLPALLDRKADSGFAMHLLDTIRTLQPTQTQVPGPPESLGLASPRYALQWKTEGAERATYDIRIGSPTPALGTAFASINHQPPFIVSGATLQMLDYIKDATVLRLKTWAGITSDDVDEIELKRGEKSIYYAQREGADWTDRKHKSLKGDLSAWLDRITHNRVLRFIDDPALAKRLTDAVHGNPLFQATLTDRHGHATHLWLGHPTSGKAQLFGLSSARPNGVFEVYPETLRAFEPPRK